MDNYLINSHIKQTSRIPVTWRKRLLIMALSALMVFAMGEVAASVSDESSGKVSRQSIVTGTVTDAGTGEELPGVNVLVRGTTTGTVTDINGAYRIQVPDEDVLLVFSFVGYNTQEISVEGRSLINVSLVQSIDMLDEIMVVAYGTTARSNLTGSATALSSEQLRDVFTPRVSTMLQDKVAGVYTRSSSGRPGQTASINIRGRGSIHTTNAPLWVVDGIAVGHSEPNLNPADIESITILKDASATSLYGSRAANGVIIVQTRSPQKDVSELRMNVNQGVTRLHEGNFSLMNSQQLYDYHRKWNTSSWFGSDLLETNTDWIDVATQMGRAQEYNMSYTGGTDLISSYVSGTYYNETGAVRGYDYERYSAVANFTIRATDRLTISSNLSGNLTATENREHGLYNAYTYLPWDTPYKEDGSVILPERDTDYRWLGRDQSNYLYNLQYNYGQGQTTNLRLNVGGDLEITDWLTFRSMNNITLGYGQDSWYTDPRSTGGWATGGSLNNGSSFSRNRLANQMLRFSNSFGPHSISAFTAFEFSDTHSESIGATGHGITAGLEVLNATSTAASVSGFKYQSARQSLLVSAQYIYDNRYMATASFNREGSSSFGRGNQYGNFWSFSAGWNMHYEDFLEDINWLNVLKLTASYGEVGNSPSGFPHLGYYELTGQYAGMPAARPYQLANPYISWEKTSTWNAGLETRVLNSVTATLEVYQRSNSGLLYRVPLSSLTGFTGIWDNIGEIRNRGVEFTLEPRIISTRDFHWNMNFNIAFNRNEVVHLYEGQPITSGNIRIAEGRDMGSYFMRVWHGVNPGNGEPLWEQVVVNEDGEEEVRLTNNYNAATLQFTGHTNSPDFTGGLTNNLTYRNFTLSANVGFVQGIYLYNSDRQLFDSDGNYPTFNHMNLADGWSRWERPGDIATHPKPIIGGNRDANRPSTRFLENASYLRLRNVTFSYQLPDNLVRHAGLGGARLWMSADNLLTITEWSGMDPEAAGMYPVAKKFMMGINVQF